MWNRVRPSGIHVLMTLDQDGCKFCLNHLVFVLIVFIACYPVGGFSSFFFLIFMAHSVACTGKHKSIMIHTQHFWH